MSTGPHTAIEPRIKARAAELGFDPVGITGLGPAVTYGAFERWLADGHAGEMAYLSRGAAKRRDTRLPFDGARSAIVVALDYGARQSAGPVARYARGDDYHDVMLGRLETLQEWLVAECGESVHGKAYVDTGPILERDLARRAGLGWIGRNTMLINPTRGSFFFIGALLVDLHLTPDAPFEADRCGSCTRCLDSCPTDALLADRVMDAERCISYLTIEHRSDIAPELRPLMGELLYGCDICQDVCPWNHRFGTELREPAFAAREGLEEKNARTLARELLSMTQPEFSAAFSGSPMKRAKLRGLRRNAAVVLGNVGTHEDMQVLDSAIEDQDSLVRDHAQWARERINGREAPTLTGPPAQRSQ